MRFLLSAGQRRLAGGNGHRGYTCNDAGQPHPRGRGHGFTEKYESDRHADRDPEVGLSGRSNRAECVKESEIDDEREGGRKHREAEQGEDRCKRGPQSPRPINDKADGKEHDRAADERSGSRHDRIKPLESPTEDSRSRVADCGGDDGKLRWQFIAKAMKRLDADDKASAGDTGNDTEQLAACQGLVACDEGR